VSEPQRRRSETGSSRSHHRAPTTRGRRSRGTRKSTTRDQRAEAGAAEKRDRVAGEERRAEAAVVTERERVLVEVKRTEAAAITERERARRLLVEQQVTSGHSRSTSVSHS